ncbi:MAG: AEC family transporter [Halanaerobiales bacterium]
MALIEAVNSIFSILLMVSLGYLFTHWDWFEETTADLFSRILIYIAMPALMLYNLTTSFNREDLFYMWSSLIIPLLGILLSYVLGTAISEIINVKKGRKGAFRALFTFSNTIFMGLPVNIAVFGDKSVPIVTMYYLVHTTLLWTLGVYFIRRDQENEKKFYLVEAVKRIISPVLVAYLLANFFIFTGISLPEFVLESCKHLSNLTTPLSMLFLGITLYGTNMGEISINKEIIFILLGCFIITPVALYTVLYFFSTSELMMKVFILEAAMPNAAVTPIIVGAYGGDRHYAAVVVTLTTILSVFVIPTYLYLFSFL